MYNIKKKILYSKHINLNTKVLNLKIIIKKIKYVRKIKNLANVILNGHEYSLIKLKLSKSVKYYKWIIITNTPAKSWSNVENQLRSLILKNNFLV